MGVWGYFSEENDNSVDIFLDIIDKVLPQKIKNMHDIHNSKYHDLKYEYIKSHLDKYFKKMEITLKKLYREGDYRDVIGVTVLCIKYIQNVQYTDPLGYFPKKIQNNLANLKVPHYINDDIKALILNSIDNEIEYTIENPEIFTKKQIGPKKRLNALEDEKKLFKKKRSNIK